MGTTDITAGQRVRFTVGTLGIIDPSQNAYRMIEETVGEGDEGEVLTNVGQMPDGWIAVKPDAYPTGYVPVHPSMVEPA